MLIKCRASWNPVKLTWTQSVRKPPVKCGFILNALIYNTKDITFLHQYDNSCVWWDCAGLSVTNKLRPWKRNAMQKSQLSTWKSKKHLKKLLHRYSYVKKLPKMALFMVILIFLVSLFPFPLTISGLHRMLMVPCRKSQFQKPSLMFLLQIIQIRMRQNLQKANQKWIHSLKRMLTSKPMS